MVLLILYVFVVIAGLRRLRQQAAGVQSDAGGVGGQRIHAGGNQHTRDAR